MYIYVSIIMRKYHRPRVAYLKKGPEYKYDSFLLSSEIIRLFCTYSMISEHNVR